MKISIRGSANIPFLRILTFGFVGLALLAVAIRMQSDTVSTVDQAYKAATPKGVSLDGLFAKARSVSTKSYPGLNIKDATDKNDAWSIAGIAPGYDFSSSVDLGKYHYSLQNSETAPTIPAGAFKKISSLIEDRGGRVIESPVPGSYPSKAGYTSYFKYKNAACYLEQNVSKTTLNLDCAYNADFAKVAQVVKPFVSLYDTSNNFSKLGSNYAVHMPFMGKSASGTIDYAALPLNGTVAYYYNDSGKGWKYHNQSGTGLSCSSLSGVPKDAFSSLCKS